MVQETKEKNLLQEKPKKKKNYVKFCSIMSGGLLGQEFWTEYIALICLKMPPGFAS